MTENSEIFLQNRKFFFKIENFCDRIHDPRLRTRLTPMISVAPLGYTNTLHINMTSRGQDVYCASLLRALLRGAMCGGSVIGSVPCVRRVPGLNPTLAPLRDTE